MTDSQIESIESCSYAQPSRLTDYNLAKCKTMTIKDYLESCHNQLVSELYQGPTKISILQENLHCICNCLKYH